MCVIIIKPKGIILNQRDLARIKQQNNDGIGIAWQQDKEVHVRKGLTLPQLSKYNIARNELLVHFRFATHGSKHSSMAHPFPVVSSRDALQLISYKTNREVLAHNGIIRAYGDNELSDTADFILSTLAHIPSRQARIALLDSLANRQSNRFALMSPKHIELFGDFQEHEGVMYSNLHWLTAIESRAILLRDYMDRSQLFDPKPGNSSDLRLDDYYWDSDQLRYRLRDD